MWWEVVELWVVGKGVNPYPLPMDNMDQCVLVPSVNQSLAKKGLEIDRIVLNRVECNGPAARLKFQPPHRSCKHLNMPFQQSAGTRLGYAVIQPVVEPPPPNPQYELMRDLRNLTTTSDDHPPADRYVPDRQGNWHNSS